MLAYEWRVVFAKIARDQEVAAEISAGPQRVNPLEAFGRSGKFCTHQHDLFFT
jgi:hypothetical protein